MGVYNSPDISQRNISEIFKGFYMVCACIYNVLVTTKYQFKDNMKALGKV